MIDVLISGAAGKMGSLSAATIAAQGDLRIVALVDPKPGASAGGAPSFANVGEALAATSPVAALEFSVPASVYENTRALLEAGVATVVGATGLSDGQVAALGAIASARDTGLVIVPNFALGAVLLMQFARQAAKYFDYAEIIEMHGADKLDAPSGTSLRTARLMDVTPQSAPEAAAVAPPARGVVAESRPHPQRAAAGLGGASGGAPRRRGRASHTAARFPLAAFVHGRRACWPCGGSRGSRGLSSGWRTS